MTKVLVTGGAGFIGSHLSQALLNKGYQVRVLDNLSYGHLEWLPSRAEFIRGDICDAATCHRVMSGISAVFHCAAMSRSLPSMDAIDVCSQVNIIGTQHMLTAARDAGVKKFIYSASSTVYGNQPIPHHEETTAADCLNFYALSKRVGEQYCLLFNKAFALPCVILRYFNVYGPRQPVEGAYALVMGIFLHQKRLGQALKIHGTGAQRRDFIHVDDVVAANIAALERNVQNAIFNIGSGSNVSIQELANYISQDQVYEPRRAGDAESTLADISLAKERLQWQPKVSFEEGLKALMNFVTSEA